MPVKEILVLEKTPTYTLSGKTGGGSIRGGVYIGWFAGYLETNGNVCVFALNLEGSSFDEVRDQRIEFTKRILTKLGYLLRAEA